MFRIKYLAEEKTYQLHSSEFGDFEGTLTHITENALEIGIEHDELMFAYKIMNENKDSIAEFGMNGCFLFSKKAA